MADDADKPKTPSSSASDATPDVVPDYERPVMPFERKASIDTGIGRWGAIGFEFGIFVTLFLLGGLWLDGKLGTRPWGAAIGALIGVTIGMYMLIRRVSGPSEPAAGEDDTQKDD
jgi:ATP synthase protein I